MTHIRSARRIKDQTLLESDDEEPDCTYIEYEHVEAREYLEFKIKKPFS